MVFVLITSVNIVKSRQKLVIANTWLMAMGYSGIKYDHNDNIYLISKIELENPISGTIEAINFQPDNAPIPSGYTKDIGQAYNDIQGFGWVREDSLGNTTPIALDIQPNTRDRNQSGIDQRLDTLIHMQYPANGSQTAVKIPAAWQYALSNGSYNVTVSVGDASNVDSNHKINIEGKLAISGFVPTANKKFTTVTRIVNVNDGKLTIDAKGGTNTKLNYVAIAEGNRPSVRTSNPTDSQKNVSPNKSITLDVNLPNSGIAVNTLSASTIKLIDSSTNTQVNANYNTSGGGDVIVVTPINPLKNNTKYLLQITQEVKDSNGVAFLPYSINFTTGTLTSGGSQIAFEQISLANVPAKPYTTVVIGPDNQLYAATLLGEILRFPISPDGILGTPQTISSLQNANDGNRTIVGMHFDPSSTDASNLILWVTNNNYWNGTANAPDWTGKITRLSGPNLETVQDYVVDLPRSIRDHLTNSIEFKPDEPNVLYVLQGSNSSTGAPDNAWGNRPERLLTAAVLRVDLSKITSLPLSVKTENGGSYNPFAPKAPVTIFASGIRNAYDLVWHTNGQLYVPTNGAAAGGNTPSTPNPLPPACQNRIDQVNNGVYTGPSVPGLNSIGTQRDYLFRVVKNSYYGHPNPKRCEWVLNGGNPTAGTDLAEVNEYPVGTLPDWNWKGIAFNFGEHFSPNGIIEYQSNVLGGQLQGKLLVVRYSAGKDIIVLTPGGANLDIVASQTGISGFTGFNPSPLDLIENPINGHIYVAQLSQETGMGTITLLRPRSSPPRKL